MEGKTGGHTDSPCVLQDFGPLWGQNPKKEEEGSESYFAKMFIPAYYFMVSAKLSVISVISGQRKREKE